MIRHLSPLLIAIALCAPALTAPAAELPRTAGGKPSPADYAQAWGVAEKDFVNRFAQDGDLSLAQIAGSAPANIVWPGEDCAVTVQVVNAGKAPLALRGRWLLVSYHFLTRSEDSFDVGMTRAGEQALGEVAVEIPAGGFVDLAVPVALPARFGGYALLFERSDGPSAGKRLFAAGLARTVKPSLEPGDRFHQVTMDLAEPAAISRLRTPANRVGVGYIPSEDANAAKAWDKTAEQLRGIQATGFPVTIEFGAGSDRGLQLPLGRIRPHLDDHDVMKDTKSDYAWLPSYDADFKAFVKRYALEFGWPKGPVNAMKLWNEPWNGISISGWGADDQRYREMYTALCEGVEEARKEGGVQILLGGCDSSSNTFDKLFPDGKDTFLHRLDFVSIHYQGLQPAGTVRMWRDRTGPEGRVRIWDTESWVANSEDRVPAVLAGMLAAGTDRLVGIESQSVVATPSQITVRLAAGGNEKRTVIHAWPVAPALTAFQDLIGQRVFRELLWEGLPWVFRFDGRVRGGAPDPDDQTIIVCGDIGAFFGANGTALRTCRGLAEVAHKEEIRAKLRALPAGDAGRAALEKDLEKPEALTGGSMTIAADPRWTLLDGTGNPVAAVDGRLRMPLDATGWYLRPNGAKGSGDALVAAVRDGRIEGYEPVAVVVRDPLEPVAAHPVVRLELLNVLNRPVTGALTVTIGDLQVEVPKQVALQAHEKRTVEARITGGAEAAGNSYPLRLVFDAGADGRAVHEEAVRVDRIAARSITVDGDLADWQGALPQAVAAAGGGRTQMEAAWLPMVKPETALAKGFATAWMAADDQAFYFAARIADDTPDPGMQRFATRDEDACFYPAVSYQLDPAATTTHREVDPGAALGKAQWEPLATRMELVLDLPGERLVSLYVADRDDLQRRIVRVAANDAASGKQLARTEAKQAGPGVWLRLRLNGKVRLVIDSPMWLRANIAAVAVDPLPADAGKAAVLAEDRTTGTAIDGIYGRELLLLPGKTAAGAIPAAWDDHEAKTEYRWPEGVRRFSYRMRAELPMGSAPNHDNVQLAFNAVGDDDKPWYPMAPGTFKGYAGWWDTDYEFALNPVREDLGGGTEVWRVRAPDLPNKHFYPHSPKAPGEGPVADAQLVVRREAGMRIVECALPWSAIPAVKAARDAGRPIRFSYRVNDNAGGSCMELARGRSVAKVNGSFKPDWIEHWANEVEFGWENSLTKPLTKPVTKP